MVKFLTIRVEGKCIACPRVWRELPRDVRQAMIAALRRSIEEIGLQADHQIFAKSYRILGSFVHTVSTTTYFAMMMNIHSIFSSYHVSDLQIHDECIICFREEYQPTMFMCGHSVVCQDCLADPNFKQCPYCRGPVSPCLLYDCRFCFSLTLEHLERFWVTWSIWKS